MALEFAPEHREPFANKLTIEVQNAIAANQSQVYWMLEHRFDLHRTANHVQLVFRSPVDTWLFLECSEEQASRLLHSLRPNYFIRFFFSIFL